MRSKQKSARSTKGLLRHAVLSELGREGGLTGDQLLTRLHRAGFLCTKQAMYQHLRHFVSEAIVVHAHRRFTLSLPWCFDQLAQLELWIKQLIHGNGAIGLPDPYSKMKLHFSSLNRLDAFWSQLLTRLAVERRTTQVVQWIPYPWFLVINPTMEMSLQRILKKTGRQVMFLTKSESANQTEKILRELPKEVYDMRVVENPQPFTDHEYLTIVDPYIFKFRMPPSLTALWAKIFSDSRSPFTELIKARSLVPSEVSIRASLESDTSGVHQLLSAIAENRVTSSVSARSIRAPQWIPAAIKRRR